MLGKIITEESEIIKEIKDNIKEFKDDIKEIKDGIKKININEINDEKNQNLMNDLLSSSIKRISKLEEKVKDEYGYE